jgi:hypothetical protein
MLRMLCRGQRRGRSAGDLGSMWSDASGRYAELDLAHRRCCRELTMPSGGVGYLLIRFPISRNKNPLGTYMFPLRCVPVETRSRGFPLAIVPLVGCFRILDVVARHPYVAWLGRGTNHFWLRWRRCFVYTLRTLCAGIFRVIRLRQLPYYWHASGRLAVVRLRYRKFINLKFKRHRELQGHII